MIAPAYLGIDIGGTRVKAGLVDEDGTVLTRAEAPSAEADSLDAWVGVITKAAQMAAGGSNTTIAAVGLAVPGAVDNETGVLRDLVERLPAAKDLELREIFANFDAPIHADNDARAALLAERRWGAARGRDNVVLLTVGTGIGSAALANGTPPGGDPLLAGNQLGHLTIHAGGRPCVCGNRGCAERYASAAALHAAMGDAGLADADVGEALSPDVQDERRPIVESWLDDLAATVVNAIHAYQPDLLVMAGGIVATNPSMVPRLAERVGPLAWTLPRRRVSIVVTALGSDSPILAGAAVALHGKEGATDA